MSGNSQAILRHISEDVQQILGLYQVNLRNISDKFHAYLWQHSGKSPANLKYTSFMSQAYLTPITGIYLSNIRQLLGIFQAYLRDAFQKKIT